MNGDEAFISPEYHSTWHLIIQVPHEVNMRCIAVWLWRIET
jgi:hypothetical protein